MAISTYFKTLTFTSTTVDYDLLQDANIKQQIKDRFGYTTEEQYTDLIAEGIYNFYFQIYCSGTTIKINGDEVELLNNEVYSSGGYIAESIKTIKISSNSTVGQFRFNIL